MPHALTGIIDENNHRYVTFQYDAKKRAILTQHAGGAERVSERRLRQQQQRRHRCTGYRARTHRFQTLQGVVKSIGSDQPAGAGCSAAASAISYDANGNVASRTDFNGNLSCYAYDLSRNLETTRLEGLAPSVQAAQPIWRAMPPPTAASAKPAANGMPVTDCPAKSTKPGNAPPLATMRKATCCKKPSAQVPKQKPGH